jgi:hypothetical protein
MLRTRLGLEIKTKSLLYGASLGASLLFTGSAAETYAAIAYNKATGLYGFSKGYDTREEAEERAAQECGPGCETILWGCDSCVALATAGNHAYGSGWDTDQESANQTAMNGCSGYADDCEIVVEVCSDD